jgi:hypothetical protein
MNEPLRLSLSLGDFRYLALDRLSGVVQTVRIAADVKSGAGFVAREAPQLIVAEPPERIFQAVLASAAAAEQAHPKLLDGFAAALQKVGEPLLSAVSAVDLLGAYHRVVDLESKLLARDYSPSASIRVMADRRNLELEVDATAPSPAVIREAEAKAIERTALLAELMAGTTRRRNANESPSADDLAAEEFGYHLLERGVNPPRAFPGIGVYGFRRWQTNLSLADPGDDHVRTTSADASLLRGVFVHIEYIDRESKNPREVEPYRIPSMKWIARTRLHVGADAPCTAFVGRPMWDTGNVERDMLKAVHTLAAACTAVFAFGVAECKIAIEGMTAMQSVRLMRALVGNVLRDPARQYLSAAFNINTPLVDDRGGSPVTVTDPKAIALLGVALTVAGGFEKVTWDGASDALSSKPFTDQVAFADLVDLVHAGHAEGLETYISAGMRAEHMTIATEAGVDGVGIGTNMHYVREDATGKRMGALKPEAVRAALEYRDQASQSLLGRAAKLLARLDRLAFERRETGGLPAETQASRIRLHLALRERDDKDCERLLGELQKWTELPDAEGHPLMARAERLLRVETNEPAGLSPALLSRFTRALDARDIATLGVLFAQSDVHAK